MCVLLLLGLSHQSISDYSLEVYVVHSGVFGSRSTRPDTNSARESTRPRVNSAGSTRPLICPIFRLIYSGNVHIKYRMALF